MKASKLIIISGISGTGKSTTAIVLNNLLAGNNINISYLHEECKNHPIRQNEFSHGSLKSVNDMDINVELMIKKWEDFKQQIILSNEILLLEACLFENITRYFFECNYPETKIISFYSGLMKILSDLNAVIIHLRTNNVQRTFQRIYPIRGEWWKKLILNDNCLYRTDNKLEGDSGVYKMTEDYQNLAIRAYNLYSGPKIAIYTDEQDWESYYKKICSFLEIDYIEIVKKEVTAPELYCGRFTFSGIKNDSGIEIFLKNKKLYCKSFWPYMKLLYEGNHTFSFMSFPIKLKFNLRGGKVHSVLVTGNYDWDAADKELIRVKNESYNTTWSE